MTVEREHPEDPTPPEQEPEGKPRYNIPPRPKTIPVRPKKEYWRAHAPYPYIDDIAGRKMYDGRRWPSIAEYLDGVTKDGEVPPLPSNILTEGYHPDYKPIPIIWEEEERTEKPLQDDVNALLLKSDISTLAYLNRGMSFCSDVVSLAHGGLKGTDLPEGLDLAKALSLGLSACRELRLTSVKHREITHEAIERARSKEIRRAFLEDRAHAVVANTLLAMDEKFEEVGLGAWMPFRFPDQWLMFCGVLRRVLAANGLIHAKNPDVYRRLLEETPYVFAEEDEGPYGKLKMPQGWPRIERLRTVTTMTELDELIVPPEALIDPEEDPPHPASEFG